MPGGLTQCDEGSGGLCFKCIFCPEVFASRNGLFKHLLAEHPSAHNRKCDRCKIFPVLGVCYECSEPQAVLCSKCYGNYESEGDPHSTCSTSSTFSKHDSPQHMQGREAQQAQSNRRRELSEPEEPLICSALRPPLQFGPAHPSCRSLWWMPSTNTHLLKCLCSGYQVKPFGMKFPGKTWSLLGATNCCLVCR